MTYLLLQTFLLLLSAYFLGAFLACLMKRMITHRAALAAARAPRVSASPAVRPLEATLAAAKPRSIDPVQPKIDILPRPEPRAAPAQAALDTTRFDRALTGPDPNAGMPRKMIAEIRPAILKSPTGPAQPLKPKPAPAPMKAEPVKPAPVQTAPVQPASQPKPAPAPVQAAPQKPVVAAAATPVQTATPVPSTASAAASAGAGAAAATAAAAAAVAAAKAAAASVVTAPRPVTPAPAPAPTPTPISTLAAKAAEPPRPATPTMPAAQPAPAPAPAQTAAPKPAAPVAQAAAPQPAPAPQPAAPQPVPTLPVTGGDDLQRIRAIDADTERRLQGIGVRRFDDIARWTPADINRVSQALGLTGRIDREQWIEQAQILAKGGETYYSRNRAAAARGATPAPSQSAAATTTTKSAAESVALAAAAAAAATKTVAPAQAAVQQPAPAAPQSTGAAGTASSALQGRSVTEMAAAAAAAIAAASASVTRGIRPIEPISPMSRANPNVSMPAKLSDAIKEQGGKASASQEAPQAAAPAKAPTIGDTEGGDDLKRIRGVGVLIEKRLNGLGITTYDQVANWTSGDIDRISQTLDFKGRIERENWVEQARILSSGGHTEFSRRVDRGDVESSKDPEGV